MDKDLSYVQNPIVEKYAELSDKMLITDEEEIKENLEKAKTEMKDAKKRAIKLRHEHLTELAKAKAAQNNTTEEAAIKQIQHTETVVKMFAYLRRVMEPNTTYGGLASIRIPIETENNDGNEWETVLDVEKIKKFLLERNKKHYGQAYGTPFTTGDLKGVVGKDGTTEECNQILQGTYNATQHGEMAQAILNELKRNDTLPLVDACISFDEYTEALKPRF